MAGAVQDVEGKVTDRDRIALVEPAVGAEIAHAGHAEALAAAHDIVEQKFVGDMRALDLDLKRVAQFRSAADMVDMAVRQPDVLNRYAGLLDRLLDFGNVRAGV